MSIYRIETWLSKGYSEEEAQYQIKIRRSTNPEYFMVKFGISYDEAVVMRDAKQKERSRKAHANKSKSDYRLKSPRCVEYWIKKGCTETEALNKVSEHQSTFSLIKCVEKYGELEGTRVWEQRQINWQNTLAQRSVEDIKESNNKKNNMILSTWVERCGERDGRAGYINHLIKKNIPVIQSSNDLENYLKTVFNIQYRYLPVKHFVKKYVKKHMTQLWDPPKDIVSWVEQLLPFDSTSQAFKKSFGNKTHWCMYLPDGKMLRSAKEIALHKLLEEGGLVYGQDYFVDGFYPFGSSMRYDFYIPQKELYIEICGMMNVEEYKQKMLFKRQTYGSVLIETQFEMMELAKVLCS